MTKNPGIHVLTDARWAELEPLIDAVRPPCKGPHDNLRETIEAILWRPQNGAKWRSIPGELGPWWVFRRSRPGVPILKPAAVPT